MLRSVHDSEGILVISLNALLHKLGLSAISLQSPLDLTPSLLIVLLESILESRLDIPTDLRHARDFPSKVQAMKIFIGVLEGDVICADVGLSDVDPRRLAAGEWDEVVFVGELLCWLGKTTGILPRSSDAAVEMGPGRFAKIKRHSSETRAHSGAASPSNQSTVTNSIHSNLSISRSAPAESNTTVTSIVSERPAPLPGLDLFDPPAQAREQHVRASRQPSSMRPPPQCIHQVDDPSFLTHTHYLGDNDVSMSDSDTAYCDCPPSPIPPLAVSTSSPTSTPVRYAGYIHPVDDLSEIRSFEARKRMPRAQVYSALGSRLGSTPTRAASSGDDIHDVGVLTRHTSPTQYTLALLSERARLLAELADLKREGKT